jgi:hypothetical protein
MWFRAVAMSRGLLPGPPSQQDPQPRLRVGADAGDKAF